VLLGAAVQTAAGRREIPAVPECDRGANAVAPSQRLHRRKWPQEEMNPLSLCVVESAASVGFRALRSVRVATMIAPGRWMAAR
jgi:hypothetical protein